MTELRLSLETATSDLKAKEETISQLETKVKEVESSLETLKGQVDTAGDSQTVLKEVHQEVSLSE